MYKRTVAFSVHIAKVRTDPDGPLILKMKYWLFFEFSLKTYHLLCVII